MWRQVTRHNSDCVTLAHGYASKTFALPEFPPAVASKDAGMAMDDDNGSMRGGTPASF